jgi:outer membrane protein OmpA-like peptidoglycan-associated protein
MSVNEEYKMNKTLLIAAVIAATTANAAHADVNYTDLRRAGVFFGSAIAGAVIAGPIGMVAAAGSGVWLDEQVEKAAGMEAMEQALSNAETDKAQLHDQLAVAEHSARHYAQSALESLQLELLFKTGQSELSDYGQQRLAQLAEFMATHDELQIRLDGYADPRGDAEYNAALSNDRVMSVAALLQNAGIHGSRISTFSHGASQSQAAQGDIDSYALERVVRIQLTSQGQGAKVAQVNIRQ